MGQPERSLSQAGRHVSQMDRSSACLSKLGMWPRFSRSRLWVLEETGVSASSYRTLLRRLPVYAKDSWRQQLAAACAAHACLGSASLVLYDVSTPHPRAR
jgi:hypothetical protein